MTTQRPLAVTEGDVAYFSLQLPDTARARQFYRAVLGWRFGADDEPGHSAQVEGQSLPLGIWDGPPAPGTATPGIQLAHRVADVAAASALVRSLGGTAGPPQPESFGVTADCLDDQGNGFRLLELPSGAPRPPVNGARAGDVAYLTISPGDEQRANEFYRALFGWRCLPGSVPGGLQVDGAAPMTGLWGGISGQNVTLMYLVDDIDAAVARVRDAGGTAASPESQPYGITAQCTDNQEMTFTLGQL